MSNEQIEQNDSAKTAVKINYILYLASLLLGVTSIIGVIMAYVNKNDVSEWMKTHYQFQIRTFWISILYSFIAVLLSFVVIGAFLFPLILIWFIVRCVKGLKALDKNEPVENPTTWLF